MKARPAEAGGEEPDDGRRPPAEGCRLDEACGQRTEGEDGPRLTGKVELVGVAIGPAGRAGVRPGEPGRQPEADRPDRQVDEEDAAPAQGPDQYPADQGAGGQRHRPAGCPGPDRGRPGRRVGVGRVQKGQGARHEERRTDALREPGTDQDGERGCRAAKGRGQSEEEQPAHVDPPRPPAVAQGTAAEEQARKAQRVGVDHPLQPDDVGVEPGGDPRKCHVDDRGVENDDDVADAGRRQRQALLPRALHPFPPV